MVEVPTESPDHTGLLGENALPEALGARPVADVEHVQEQGVGGPSGLHDQASGDQAGHLSHQGQDEV